MNHTMINAAVSLQALQQKLDIIANNVANVNTVGYKRKEATFEDILTNIKQQPAGFQQQGRLSPLGFRQGWGAKLSESQLDLTQGTLQSTGVTTDLAIEGGALFELRVRRFDANGNPVVETAYTREGSFQLAVQPQDPDNRYLTTKDGHYVLGVDDQPIRIPNDDDMIIEADGTVKVRPTGQPGSQAETIGQIKMMRVIRQQYLEQTGDNLYRIMPGASNANGEVLQQVDNNSPLQEKVDVRQGYLEQSNVNMADEMTDLVNTQRAFQLSSRALTSADTMMNLTNNLRG